VTNIAEEMVIFSEEDNSEDVGQNSVEDYT
jgi:hypothetical protein